MPHYKAPWARDAARKAIQARQEPHRMRRAIVEAEAARLGVDIGSPPKPPKQSSLNDPLPPGMRK